MNPYDEMKKTIENFHNDNDIFEIRIFSKNDGVVSGYFKNDEKGISSFLKASEHYVDKSSICFTLNPVDDSLWERSKNKLTTYAKTTTKDAEIKIINYLHLDLDPVRSADTSATELEREVALKRAEKIMTFLAENYDMNTPIFSCSGNGYNLDYYLGGIDNSAENKALLKSVLNSLSILFSDKRVEVDLTTYNPSRVIKVFGCKSVKGKDTAERPHRFSCIEDLPNEQNAVPLDALQRLANISKGAVGKSKGKAVSIEEYLQKNNISVNKKKVQSGSTIFVLDNCPWNDEHRNKSAFVIQFDNGNVYAGCHHNGCSGNGYKEFLKVYGNNIDSKDSESEEDSESETGAIQKCVDCISSYIQKYFEDQNGECYVHVKYQNINRTFRTLSKDFEKLIGHIYHNEIGKIATPSLKKIVAEHFDGIADFSGNNQRVEKRVNKDGDYFYYDLCNDESQAVRIGSDGVKIVDDKPDLFTRSNNMLPQVIPKLKDFKNDDLLFYIRKHFKVKGKQNILLFTVYLLIIPFRGNAINVVEAAKPHK